MAKIECPKCRHRFSSNNTESIVTRGAATAAGAGGGAWFGSGLGIVAGPIGIIAGTIPGAIVGGVTGFAAADQFRRSPKCRKVFKT